MSNVAQALWGELLKARRSKMPLWTALAFSLAPLAGGFFMIVMRDPALARRLGMISAKAQIVAGSADWPTYLGLIAQATAVGGIMLFSIIGSWVFGREFADRTAKDLLALPTPRFAIVAAKVIVVVLWSAALTAVIYLVGLGVGAAIGLPSPPAGAFRAGTATVAGTAVLTIAAVTPVSFVASAGRGYLPPMGAAILALILAQLVAVAGWGEYFPWSIPALYAGMAGSEATVLGAASYLVVGLTSLGGIAATFIWWAWADQSS